MVGSVAVGHRLRRPSESDLEGFGDIERHATRMTDVFFHPVPCQFVVAGDQLPVHRVVPEGLRQNALNVERGDGGTPGKMGRELCLSLGSPPIDKGWCRMPLCRATSD